MEVTQVLKSYPSIQDAVRGAQALVRNALSFLLAVETDDIGPYLSEDEDPDADYSTYVRKVRSEIYTMKTLIDEIGSRPTWRQLREMRRATHMAAQWMEEVPVGSPYQAVSMAESGLGLI